MTDINWTNVQTILKDKGLYTGKIDGIPGPLSFAGVLRVIGEEFPATIASWGAPMFAATQKHGITEPYNLGIMLATVIEESGGFTRLIENLNYSTFDRLHQVWPHRFPTKQSAHLFLNQPELLANAVYANRYGNGPPESGDGHRFRGQNPVQLTFRMYFQKHADHFGMSLEDFLKWNLTPAGGAMSAAFYWIDREGVVDAACAGDMTAVTLKVNGALTNLKLRMTLWERAKGLLLA